MHFLQETREPLVDALAHGTSAGISTRHNPDHWIRRYDFEHIKDFDLHASSGFLVLIHWWKVRFLWRVSDDQRHAGEAAALRVPEPGSIYFYHSGCTECLHVSVDAANHDEQPKQSPK